jgi:hypothetical protein
MFQMGREIEVSYKWVDSVVAIILNWEQIIDFVVEDMNIKISSLLRYSL